MGVSLVSVDPERTDDMALQAALEAADVSLYAAKRAGRDRVGPLPTTPLAVAR